jgi:hypothetical protein
MGGRADRARYMPVPPFSRVLFATSETRRPQSDIFHRRRISEVGNWGDNSGRLTASRSVTGATGWRLGRSPACTALNVARSHVDFSCPIPGSTHAPPTLPLLLWSDKSGSLPVVARRSVWGSSDLRISLRSGSGAECACAPSGLRPRRWPVAAVNEREALSRHLATSHRPTSAHFLHC